MSGRDAWAEEEYAPQEQPALKWQFVESKHELDIKDAIKRLTMHHWRSLTSLRVMAPELVFVGFHEPCIWPPGSEYAKTTEEEG